MVQETWLSFDPSGGAFPLLPSGWSSLCSHCGDDEAFQGQGLCTMVNMARPELAAYAHQPLAELRTDSFEALLTAWGPLVLCNVYIRHGVRPDYVGLCDFISAHSASGDGSPLLVAGDFNWPGNFSTLAGHLLAALGVVPLLQPDVHATRGDNLLDNIFYRPAFPVTLVSLDPGALLSDHLAIVGSVGVTRALRGPPPVGPPRVRFSRLSRLDPAARLDLATDVRLAVAAVMQRPDRSALLLNDELLRVAGLHLGVWTPRPQLRNPAMSAPVCQALDRLRRARRRHPRSPGHHAVEAALADFRRLYTASVRKAARDLAASIDGGRIGVFFAMYRTQRCASRAVSPLSPGISVDDVVAFWRGRFASEPSRTALSDYLAQPPPPPGGDVFDSELIEQALSATSPSSAGPDGMSVRFLKAFKAEIVPCLPALFNEALARGLPAELKLGRTVLLPKERRLSPDGSNTRPITIQPALSRLFLKSVDMCARAHIREHGPVLSVEQAACLPGRSCYEHVFLLSLVTQHHRKRRKPLFAAFLDIEKAFDSIDHGELLAVLRKLQLSEDWVRAIAVVLEGNATEIFGRRVAFERGTIQGVPPSSLFCLLFLEDLSRYLRAELAARRTAGVALPWDSDRVLSSLNHLLFMDDLLLLAEDLGELQALLDVCSAWADARRLRFSPTKSKLMQLAGAPLEEPLPDLCLSGAPLGWVVEFPYLGVPIYGVARRLPRIYPYNTAAVSQSLWALRQLLRDTRRLPRLDPTVMRMGLVQVAYQQALYGTAIQDIDYDDLDRRVNRALRLAYQLPVDTHVVHMRYELFLWPSRFWGHARALQFAWRVRHAFWYAEGFEALCTQHGPDLESSVLQCVPVYRRLSELLAAYDLSWRILCATEAYANWCELVQDRITAAVRAWVSSEARRVKLPHLTRQAALSVVYFPKREGPLLNYHLIDSGLSRVALHFRSDRIQFHRHQPPPPCSWCHSGSECGRHFLLCPRLPPALQLELRSIASALSTFVGEETLTPVAVASLICMDDMRLWSRLSRTSLQDPACPAAPLVKRCLVFQRSILRAYRRAFAPDVRASILSFPKV